MESYTLFGLLLTFVCLNCLRDGISAETTLEPITNTDGTKLTFGKDEDTAAATDASSNTSIPIPILISTTTTTTTSDPAAAAGVNATTSTLSPTGRWPSNATFARRNQTDTGWTAPDGGNSSFWQTVSPPIANQTGNTTYASTRTSRNPILCYNCSGNGDCLNVTNTFSNSTCISNTGICYIQYNFISRAMTLSCTALYPASGGASTNCVAENSVQATKTSCEQCCTKTLCNGRSSQAAEQTCRNLLGSDASQLRSGRFAFALALIAVTRWPFFNVP